MEINIRLFMHLKTHILKSTTIHTFYIMTKRRSSSQAEKSRMKTNLYDFPYCALHTFIIINR